MTTKYRESKFPFNLLADAISPEFAADTASHPKDLIPTLLYILSDMSNPLVAKAMTLRYNNRMTLTEIGSLLFMTAEGVRKLCVRGIEILQEPEISDMVKLGIREFYRQKYSMTVKLLEPDVVCPVTPIIGPFSSSDDAEKPIETLNLSTRSLNCLHRAGYAYIYQLKSVSIDELLAIRNLGKLSAAEILQKTHDYYTGKTQTA